MTALAARLRPRLARLAESDTDLLARFVASRDDDAFSTLVRRHGPAVLAVCRRLTRDRHLADDAFQAVFLVLARRATHVRRGEPLAAWLYGVAVRTARKAAARAARRREVRVATDVPARPAEPFDPDAALAVLEEVDRLSARYRAAVVLCELEGRSRAAAARELGIAEGTLSSRLAAARKVLAAVAAERAAAVVRTPVSFTPRARELAEAAMRSGHAWWCGIGAATAVVVAAGLVSGQERPVPQPAPPPAPVRAPAAADRSQLIVGMMGEVRYLTPAGKEVTRLTNDAVARSGPFVVPPREAAEQAQLNFAGRPTPDGRLPICHLGQVWLVRPGTPVAFEPTRLGYSPNVPPPYLVVWSPDGKRAIARHNHGSVFGGDLIIHTVDEIAPTGATERLSLPAGHNVVDWSADGAWFLTWKSERRLRLLKGFESYATLYRVSRDGKTVEELAPKTEGVQQAAFAPDGKRVAYVRPTADGGIEVVVLDAGARRVAAAEPGGVNRVLSPACVRWSPDGTRIGYAFGVLTAGDRPGFGMRVVTCAAAGGDRREAFTLDTTPGDRTAGFAVFDWR
ncbi:sigma-70 family RNA polymerase sigma factor [bacterium]|nr:sigma-70 family RNA polymerase sigma factor [bacterium]